MANFNSVDEAVNFFIRAFDNHAYESMNNPDARNSFAQRGIYCAYSDAVFYNNKGIMLAGKGGNGKSEMADRFVQQGAIYLSQDFTWMLVENGRPFIINTLNQEPKRSSIDFLFWIEAGGMRGFNDFELGYLIDLMFDRHPEDIKMGMPQILSRVAAYKYNTGEEGPKETFDSLRGIIDSN